MKVAIYSICKSTPHFETDLEIAQKHLAHGDTVSFVQCGPWLKCCQYDFHSPATSRSRCYICQARLVQGIALLRGKDVTMQLLPGASCSGGNVPEEFLNSEELGQYRVGNFDLGMAAISTLATRISKEPRIDTRVYRDAIHDELLTGYSLYQSFLSFLKEDRPDLLYVFNGRFTVSRAALRACEALKIDFCTHERAGHNSRYILRPNTFPHDFNYVAKEIGELWQRASAERVRVAENWFEERRSARDQGWRSYVKEQRKGLLPSGFDGKNYNVAIFNSTMEEQVGLPGRDPYLYLDELEGLARVSQSLNTIEGIKVYVRMHPNLRGCANSQVKRIRAISDQYESLITLIPPESPVSTYDLLDNCDLVISFGTTVGVEACYWGKPVILAGRAYYESLDCCYKPQTHEELMTLLLSRPLPKSRGSALPYAYWEATNGIPYEYYRPTGIFSGTFNRRSARKLSWHVLLVAYVMRFAEAKNAGELLSAVCRPFREIARARTVGKKES